MPYFAAKKARTFGGAACANSCQAEIPSSVRNSTGFTLHYRVPGINQIGPSGVD